MLDDNKNKILEYEENPYNGICINAAILGIVSFCMMRVLHYFTNNPMFGLEHSINMGFTAAIISPLYMFVSVFKEVKRYEMYEKGIENCRFRVAVSIPVNRGYLYINHSHLYLVFASKKPNFISSIKMSTIEKIIFYDEKYICLIINNEHSSNPYEIKFRVDGNMKNTVEKLNSLLPAITEDKRIRI